MTIDTAESLRTRLKQADALEVIQNMLDSVGLWDVIAERDRLRQALSEYANSANWKMDAEHAFRVWLEPGSNTPESHHGFHLARMALNETSQ